MRPLIALLFFTAGLAGCLADDRSYETKPAAFPAGQHPWPAANGSEWPTDLVGPFSLLPEMPLQVRVPSHDGVELGGWVFLPDLPDGILAPTIVLSSPYSGLSLNEAPARDSWGAGPIDLLVEHGYAVAAFSVRGTGVSGGCFENKGPTEQADQLALVEWAAAQSWSNGRVGMMGISYPATTPLMAAIQAPPALKTIVPIAPVTDVYTELHSTQGALYTSGAHNELGRRAAVSLTPSLSDHAGGEDPLVVQRVEDAAARACPDYARVLQVPAVGWLTDDRDGDYWQARSLIQGFPDITASVLFVHGLLETAHPNQEDVAWAALAAGSAPTAMMLGQWDHEVPRVEDWEQRALAWLDFWLKGVGDPPALGVEYQESTGAWHRADAWPPEAAREEVLYLAGDGLATEPAQGVVSFRSLPSAKLPDEGHGEGHWPLCDGGLPVDGVATQVAFASEPLAASALLAGNPMAYLQVESDQPGGVLALQLYALPADGACEAARLLSRGAADLRFHGGSFSGSEFPVGEITPVRIDLLNLAESLEEGERLVLLASRGEYATTGEVANPLSDERFSRSGQPWYPTLALHGSDGPEASHLVLPFVEGGLGGSGPSVDYPPPRFAVAGPAGQ